MDILTNPFATSMPMSSGTADILSAPVAEAPPIDADFRDVDVADSATTPIDLDPYNVDRLMNRVKAGWSQAYGAKGKIDQDAMRDRRAYDLEEKLQAYKGQPNITLPLTRNKVDGMVGQLVSAMFDADPLAASTPLTEEAVDVAPIYDAAMERELKLDGADKQFKMSLREAAIVGTTFLGFSITELATGERAIQAHLTRLENFFMYPVEVDDLSDCTTFRRFTMPYYKLKEQAIRGVYDIVKVQECSKSYGSSAEPTTKEARDNFNQVNFFDDENRPIELLEVFIRYAPESPGNLYGMGSDLQETQLYHIICTKDTFKPFSIKLNPFREAFDMPPYCAMRLAKRPGYLFGGSTSKLLRAVQKIADDAMNDRLAYNKFALTPIIQGDQNNPIFKRLQQGGRLIPGTAIPTNGRPDMAGIQALQLPSPVVTIEDMDLAVRWADQGTHSDFQLTGQMPTKRMTAYETQASRGAGELKLRMNMRDFADDAADALKMFWALYDAYKVDPEGVVEIYNEGNMQLLASREIPEKEFMGMLESTVNAAEQNGDMETLQELQTKVKPDPETGTLKSIGSLSLVKGGIPSTNRGDLSWTLASDATVADKASMLRQLDAFAPYLQLLPQADMDSRVWQFLKMRLEAADIKNWKKLIGSDPKNMQDPAAFQADQAGFQQNMAQSSVR